MEQLPPIERARVDELKSFLFHWSQVAELTFRTYGVKTRIRWLMETARDAQKPDFLTGTVLETKEVARYPTDRDARQAIIDAVLDATTPPAEFNKTFNWEAYADAVGGWVDFFDQSLKVNEEYGVS